MAVKEWAAWEFNRLGVCTTCGRIGAYNVPWREGELTHRCPICAQSREAALLEAARFVTEYAEQDPERDVHSAIVARLAMALTAFERG